MALQPVQGRLVTVFGGSGFIGRHIVRALARRGYRVRAAVRRPDLAGHLQPLGTVGQIHAVQANLRYRDSVERAVEGAWGVINCVGIMAQSGRQRFDAIQDFGARAIAQSAAGAGASRMVQISAIGADSQSDSIYARTKAAGEAGVKAALPQAAILRPSIVFGPEDAFFNMFANMARYSPVLPVFGPETRFQPVFVGDVAEAAMAGLEREETAGRTYELGGPNIETFHQLMERMLAVTNRRRMLLPVPLGIARIFAAVISVLPGAPLTLDQVRLLARDNVVSDEAARDGRTLEGLGISPRSMDLVLPTYLDRFRRTGRFNPQPG